MLQTECIVDGERDGRKTRFQRVRKKDWRRIGINEFEGVRDMRDNSILIQPVEKRDGKVMNLSFQVAGVRAPLIAV